jgi:hypothetical protein
MKPILMTAYQKAINSTCFEHMVTYSYYSLKCNAGMEKFEENRNITLKKTRFSVQCTQLSSESGNFLSPSSQQKGKLLRHTVAAKVTKAGGKF